MADSTHQHRLRFRFAIDSTHVAGATIRSFSMREAFSECFQAQLVVSSANEIDRETNLGKRAFVEVADETGGSSRFFHGCLTRIRSQQQPKGSYETRMTLEPRLGLLKRGVDHRIFRPEANPAITLPEIIEKLAVSDIMQIKKEDLSFDAVSVPPKGREYVVQYGESDYAFLTRLLAEEGISFVFDHPSEGERVLFFDDPPAVLDPPDSKAFPGKIRYEQGTSESSYAIQRMHWSVETTIEATALRRYDVSKPEKPHDVRFPKAESPFEIHDHQTRFDDDQHGERIAQAFLERRRLFSRVSQGVSDCQYFAPGRTFELADHPRDEMNAKYRIVSVTHRMDVLNEEMRYSNEFVAVEVGTPIRPERIPAPLLGVGVGIVTGETEELFSSEHGEVRVRFPWDRSDSAGGSASTWCRVGQLALPGSMVMPRVGFETLVDRSAWDINCPLVLGHLYNAHQPPPYDPKNKPVVSSIQSHTVQKGDGANEIRLDDTAGQEEILFHASLDQTCVIGNDARTDIKHDEKLTIGENHTLEIGGHQTAKVIENRSIEVGAMQSIAITADLNEGITENDSLTVALARDHIVGGDLTETISGTLQRTVNGMAARIGVVSIARKIKGNSTATVMGLRVDAVGTSIMSNCGLLRMENVGGLKLVQAKSFAVDCGLAYEHAGVGMTVKLSGSRTDRTDKNMNVTAKTGFSVKARNINLTAKSELKVTVGQTEILLKGTSVTLTTKTADLTGAMKHGSKVKHMSGP